MQDTLQTFDQMYKTSDDPWGFRTRWYEARKRALTVACLPARTYRRGYEPGCANGELAAALAVQCASLRVSDGSNAAVQLARSRLSALAHVDVVQEWLPDEWPSQLFDLIVLSEFCFYLSETALASVAERASASLSEEGTLLACHWRHPVKGFALQGDTVHEILAEHLKLARLVHHEERDFVLDVWSPSARSVAQREGFV
ncbi:MAG: nodulation S family protein [Rhodoferax sp.]|nr:nodulation S family protein [Rhodoferax sp.]